MKINKKQYHTGEILPSAALAYSELSPYWSVYWSALKRDFLRKLLEPQNKKVPNFLRNQELFGGDCWTRIIILSIILCQGILFCDRPFDFANFISLFIFKNIILYYPCKGKIRENFYQPHSGNQRTKEKHKRAANTIGLSAIADSLAAFRRI